jgi:hypothetical protein
MSSWIFGTWILGAVAIAVAIYTIGGYRPSRRIANGLGFLLAFWIIAGPLLYLHERMRLAQTADKVQPSIEQKSEGPNSPNVVGNGNNFNFGPTKPTFSTDQIQTLKDSLQRQKQTGMARIEFVSSLAPEAEGIVSAFRAGGWQTVPIEVGNVSVVGSPAFSGGVVLIGPDSEPVTAAKQAFHDAKIDFQYENGDPITVGPGSLGPCDLAVTINMMSK